MSRVRIRIDAVLLLLAMVSCATGCGVFGDSSATVAPVEVVAVRMDLDIVLPARGEFAAMNASPIGVPRVPTGALKVKELVEEGSIVEEGEVVVVFDDSQLNIELDNHRATFRSTDRQIDGTGLTADIDRGGVEVMRQVAALERDNVEAFKIDDSTIYSRREILEDEVTKDDAQATIVFADASLLLKGEYYDIEERILGVEKEQVEGNIERVEFSLGSLVLKAPLGGLVVYRKNWRGSSVAVGDSLWPGNVIMSIVDPKSTALEAYVLERDAAGLTEGAEVEVRADAMPERTFIGKVTTIAEISRPIERGSPVKYTEVKIEIVDDAERALLKPGMKGEARIIAGRLDEVVVIPRTAVRSEAENPFVVIMENGVRARRPVELGEGDVVRVSVTDGLSEGDRVLIGGDDGVAPATEPASVETADAGAGA
ncbi:MAG: HlyD family efflux transporter periplasmic adaptor subunit [bacterium]|nr:HlyD family efflux transporter periplasmic adaptor subunit [bacterium]